MRLGPLKLGACFHWKKQKKKKALLEELTTLDYDKPQKILRTSNSNGKIEKLLNQLPEKP